MKVLSGAIRTQYAQKQKTRITQIQMLINAVDILPSQSSFAVCTSEARPSE